jgi:pSer/pThr/pTyr-binding forkhead associated (FHA) protein
MKNEQDERAIPKSQAQEETQKKDVTHTTTVEFSRKTFVGEISVKHSGYLEIINGGVGHKVVQIGEGVTIIGRSPECDVQLAVENVSRMHARIRYRDEEYYLEDLDSTNGTYVNSIRVVGCVLRNNDLIEIGGVKIIFTEEKRLRQYDDLQT